MLERAVAIYLALATVATVAIFPTSLRAAGAAAREQRSPTDPPSPTAPDDVVTPLIGADLPEEQCVECDEAADDLRVDVAGVAEVALTRATESASLADVEDGEDDDPTAAELAGRDPLTRPASHFPQAEQLAGLAAGLAGLPYSWGGISPATGFDCSGLVYYVHSQFGVTLNRDAAAQFGTGRQVQRGDLQPGDIVFFSDTYTRGISHDGIYLGDGHFVHAVQPGSGVRITSMGDGYWSPRYVGARRVLE